jgi:hypothetical protein
MAKDILPTVILVMLSVSPGYAIADPVDPNFVLSNAMGKIVHLMIIGDKALGSTFDPNTPPINGTGVVFRTSSSDPAKRYRILTAKHVVKDDGSWKPTGTGPARRVYVTAMGEVEPQEFKPVTGVVVNDQFDIAEVVASPLAKYFAVIRPDTLPPGKQYVVVSWGLDSSLQVSAAPIAKMVTVLGPDTKDPTLVRLQANLVPTESGSPVMDSDGAVVAIVVMREETEQGSSSTALALPINQVAKWMDGVVKNPVAEPPPEPLSKVAERINGKMIIQNVPEHFDFVQAPDYCVFLGKSSSVKKTTIQSSEAPFGREFLQKAIENPDALLGTQLNITPDAGTVDIFSNCPDVQNGKVYYGAVVSILDDSAAISLRQVVRLNYRDDEFLWGIISAISLKK